MPHVKLIQFLRFLPFFALGISPALLQAVPDAAITVTVNGTGVVAVGSQFGVTVSISNTGDQDFLIGDSIAYQLQIQGGGNTVFSTGGNIANGLGVGIVENQTFTFTMPYGEAPRFNAGWTALATVSATRDTNTANNQATANFNITVPDLQVLNLQGTGNVLPGQDVTVTFGTVNNPAAGNAGTDPGVLLSAEAILVDVATGLTVDREAALVNSGSNGIAAGGNIQSTISNLHIPSDANPGDQFTVQVTVDPGNPGLVVETNEANNDQTLTLTVGGASNLQFVSFTHDEGTFFARRPCSHVAYLPKYRNGSRSCCPSQYDSHRLVLRQPKYRRKRFYPSKDRCIRKQPRIQPTLRRNRYLELGSKVARKLPRYLFCSCRAKWCNRFHAL